jgi:hypothetical protein
MQALELQDQVKSHRLASATPAASTPALATAKLHHPPTKILPISTSAPLNPPSPPVTCNAQRSSTSIKLPMSTAPLVVKALSTRTINSNRPRGACLLNSKAVQPLDNRAVQPQATPLALQAQTPCAAPLPVQAAATTLLANSRSLVQSPQARTTPPRTRTSARALNQRARPRTASAGRIATNLTMAMVEASNRCRERSVPAQRISTEAKGRHKEPWHCSLRLCRDRANKGMDSRAHKEGEQDRSREARI